MTSFLFSILTQFDQRANRIYIKYVIQTLARKSPLQRPVLIRWILAFRQHLESARFQSRPQITCIAIFRDSLNSWIWMSQNTVPRLVMPWDGLSLCACLIACQSTRIFTTFIMAAITNHIIPSKKRKAWKTPGKNFKYLAIKICICYNAGRQMKLIVQYGRKRKPQSVRDSGVFYSYFSTGRLKPAG